MPSIAVVDYVVGNLLSVKKALETVGASTCVTRSTRDLEQADAIVLPGVGAFRDAQENLRKLTPAVLQHIESGKPLLGICLGLQLLFTESTEGGTYKGLDYFKGKVVRLPGDVKVPHMGWNTLDIIQEANPFVEGLSSGIYVYFVHSYYGEAAERRDMVAETEYGVRFPSILSRGCVYTTQFHPEKSGKVGLRLLENFVDIVRR